MNFLQRAVHIDEDVFDDIRVHEDVDRDGLQYTIHVPFNKYSLFGWKVNGLINITTKSQMKLTILYFAQI